MARQTVPTVDLDAILDDEVFVLLPEDFSTDWIPLPPAAAEIVRRDRVRARSRGPISSDGSPLQPKKIAVDPDALPKSPSPRSLERAAWEKQVRERGMNVTQTLAEETSLSFGAHPALVAAEYAQHEEELLSVLELEIDREIEVELDRAPKVSTKRLALVAAVLAPVLLPFILVVGWPYYSLTVAERVFHPFHDVLRSSGTLGLPLGIGALGLMVANLAYLVRKKFVSRFGVQTLPGWLRFHIFTGLLGPFMALFHAGFVPTSAMGIFSTASMAIVITSGIVGRYFLTYVPKQGDLDDVKVDEVRRRLVIYKRKLMSMGVRTAFLDIEPRTARRREPGLVTSLFRVALGDHAVRRDMRKLRQAIEMRTTSSTAANQMQILVGRLCRERQWLMRSQELRRLIIAWRFFHRWFAITLFVSIAFHVWLALRFGGLS